MFEGFLSSKKLEGDEESSKEYRWRIRFLFGVIPSVAISDWIICAW